MLRWIFILAVLPFTFAQLRSFDETKFDLSPDLPSEDVLFLPSEDTKPKQLHTKKKYVKHGASVFQPSVSLAPPPKPLPHPTMRIPPGPRPPAPVPMSPLVLSQAKIAPTNLTTATIPTTTTTTTIQTILGRSPGPPLQIRPPSLSLPSPMLRGLSLPLPGQLRSIANRPSTLTAKKTERTQDKNTIVHRTAYQKQEGISTFASSKSTIEFLKENSFRERAELWFVDNFDLSS